MEKSRRAHHDSGDSDGRLDRTVHAAHTEVEAVDLRQGVTSAEVTANVLDNGTDNGTGNGTSNGKGTGTGTGSGTSNGTGRLAAPQTLELHEIQPYVQRELDGLEVALLPNRGRMYRQTKRMLDLAVAVPGLILAAPVIGLLSLLIRLESRGPAIFRQQRVGLDGRVFTFYKFRTMYVDARQRFPELYDYSFDTSELSSRYYKQAGDPRNTKLGVIIRQTTLDELPNLINVIRGDASIVGPRPELPEMIRHYRPSELAKFTVKPGLTCLAACTGRNTLTIDEQIRADVEYVAGQSLKLDVWIIAETARMIVKSIGAV